MPIVASIAFSPNLQTHVAVERCEVGGATVREALEEVIAVNERLRSYVLDDRGAVRKHIAVVVDGVTVADREQLSDALAPDSEIFVMQALSGG